MEFSFVEGSAERFQFAEFECICGFEAAGCSFRTGMFYTGRFDERGQWMYVWDDSYKRWNTTGQDFNRYFVQKHSPPTWTAMRMDRLFNEFLYLAASFGFLQEWDKSEGYAIISTHARMKQKLGLPGYLERQSRQNIPLDQLRPHLDSPEEFTSAVGKKIEDANKLLHNHDLYLDVKRYSHHTEAAVCEHNKDVFTTLKERTFPGDIGVKLEDRDGKCFLRFYLKSFGAIASKDKFLDMSEVCRWVQAASGLIDSLNALEIDLTV